MINLEQRIKEKLSGTTLSIERLAIRAGITKQTLHNIFNKNDVKLSQLIKISEVLNTDLAFFLDIDQKRKDAGNSDNSNDNLKLEIDSLQRENQLLREMVDMLKKQAVE